MEILLLDIQEYTFHKFPTPANPRIPPYAIFSHTRSETAGEARYREFHKTYGRGRPPSPTDQSLEKIINCCKLAAADGFEYAWIDIICVDNTDPRDVGHSINVAFQRYKESAVCYAYLSDVPAHDEPGAAQSAFRRARWFTRGWTLHELIAPSSIVFYNREWKAIGTKASLRCTISEVTGISEDVLQTGDLGSVSVSTRLSWGGRRQTSRLEDEAYCLLGIFNITTPIMYGERRNAFRRLLLEIMEKTDDPTVLSWAGTGHPSGMLARSPKQYSPSFDARALVPRPKDVPFSMTNRGLQIEPPLLPLPLLNMYAAILNCCPSVDPSGSAGGYLVHFVYRRFPGHPDYYRVFNEELTYVPANFEETYAKLLTTEKIYINDDGLRAFHINRATTFRLKSYPFRDDMPGPIIYGSHQIVGGGAARDRFSCCGQRQELPPQYMAQLDDNMVSAVLLFKSRESPSFAIYLMLWETDIKVGIATDVGDDNLTTIADSFLFQERPLATKQPGSHTIKAKLSRGKYVAVTLDDPSVDGSMALVCDVSISDLSGFWLHAVGPGVWPGCWTRYFDSLATATPGKERAWLCRGGTLQGLAQVLMVLVLVASSINTYTKYNT